MSALDELRGGDKTDFVLVEVLDFVGFGECFFDLERERGVTLFLFDETRERADVTEFSRRLPPSLLTFSAGRLSVAVRGPSLIGATILLSVLVASISS